MCPVREQWALWETWFNTGIRLRLQISHGYIGLSTDKDVRIGQLNKTVEVSHFKPNLHEDFGEGRAYGK